MDVNEFSALCAIVLMFADAKGLQDRATVLAVQTKFLDSFRKYTISRYPHERRRYGRLLLKLPILRILATKAYGNYVNGSLDADGNASKLNLLIEQSIIWLYIYICFFCKGFIYVCVWLFIFLNIINRFLVLLLVFFFRWILK